MTRFLIDLSVFGTGRNLIDIESAEIRGHRYPSLEPTTHPVELAKRARMTELIRTFGDDVDETIKKN